MSLDEDQNTLLLREYGTKRDSQRVDTDCAGGGGYRSICSSIWQVDQSRRRSRFVPEGGHV
jgi:hypothetical protein